MYQHRLKGCVALAGTLVVLAAGAGACSRTTARHDAGATADAPTGVILGLEDLERWVAEGRAVHTRMRPNCGAICALQDMKIPADVEFWRPSPAQVFPFQRRLYRALRQAWRDQGHDDLPERYSVGYIGFVQDGKRLLYAQGECGDTDLRQQGWTLVLNGGICYFVATYNLETGKF
jgi:hypothetical protein